MKLKTVMAVGVVAMFAVASVSQAALSLSNGNFETGGGANITDVTDWYDSNLNDAGDGPGGFWEGTWQSDAQSVNGSSTAIFSSFESDDFGMPSTDTVAGGYLYQSLGTADGETSLTVYFNWGGPTDDPGGRDLGLTVSVLAYDGLGGFTAADDVDIYGATGVTLLDSASFTMTSVAGGYIEADQATLDLSGAGSQELFLRFNGYNPTTTESWAALDNVVIPEPATIGLMGIFGAAMVFARRRFRR